MSNTSRVCPQCGQQFPSDRRFCSQDGSELVSATAPRQTAAPGTGAPETTGTGHRTRSKEVIVGAVSILVVVAILTVLFAWRESQIYRLSLTFGEGHGLKVGDTVYVRGADVGEVVGTTFLKGERNSPFVATIQVQPDQANQFREHSSFFIVSDKIFLNKKCIEVFVPNDDTPQIPNGTTLPGEDSTIKYLAAVAKDKVGKEVPNAASELKGVFKSGMDVLRGGGGGQGK